MIIYKRYSLRSMDWQMNGSQLVYGKKKQQVKRERRKWLDDSAGGTSDGH